MRPRIINSRTPEQWAEVIRTKWQDNVTSIFDVGLLLANAREELGAAAFWVMVRDGLKFDKGTASKLMAVGTDERLLDVAPGQLPAAWTILYALTRLTGEQFQIGIESGVIHAGMERKDIAQLKPPKEKPPSPKPQPAQPPEAEPAMELDVKGGSSVIGPIDRCTMAVRQAVMSIMSELGPEQWGDLLDALRDELNDVERVAAERKAA